MLDPTHEDDKTAPDGSKLFLTVRGVFVIDPAKKIRLIITYPASTGRNFVELIRVVDSLQLADGLGKKVTTPANWTPGEKIIIHPSVSDEEAKKLFGEFTTDIPYLRLTKQP
eukprot:TRINITY_DN2392_c0_g4_i2.p2 TRINITY_DN2392_c0_g4~~TRINITY_DN2392_c0_g4_i2.p2  ORF type:complete len:112 (+),score=26.11 TRINITY_DN2392_c0_g4_i2:457-792(+)